MKESIRLGRIAGVNVGLNLSVLVIFAILVLGLAAGRFPEQFPGETTGVYLFAAGITAVLFFASLLAHELAHAIVARRNGVEVEGIVLWLFGGVAELKNEPRTPGADARIAAVGPLTSVVAAVIFGLVAVVLDRQGVSGLVVAVPAYLAAVNVLLAAFNLVPAAPLDGGRLLRALLWSVRGDRTKAAVTAARAGRLFGYLLIAFGFIGLVSGQGLGGLWFVLIGLFLVNAALMEERQSVVVDALRGLRVRDVMTHDPVVAAPEEVLEEFITETVLTHRFSTYPLVDDEGRLVGLTTLNRIREVPPPQRGQTILGEIAVPMDELPVAAPHEPLVDLLRRMAGDDRRAVVVDEERHVLGVVSPSDVNRALRFHDLAAPPQR